MIGTYEIKVSAARPNMPLAPMFAFKGSPSSLRIMDVPKKIGDWNITSVKVVVHYPDNTTKQTTATRNGNVWIATFEGCEVSGKIGNGLEIDADGTDENCQGVEGYVLGVGDLYILERDTLPSDIVSKSTMRYCDVVPEHPVAGDFIVVEGCAKFYDGTEWIVIDTDLSEYATKAELDALDDKVDSTKSELLNSIASVEGEIPSKVSELTNDVGYITASAIPANLSSFNNDVGFITSSAIPSSVSAFENDAGYITANALPTKTSDLTNDSGFITTDEVKPLYEYDTSTGTFKPTEMACYAVSLVGAYKANNRADKYAGVQPLVDFDPVELTPKFTLMGNYLGYYPWKLSKFFDQTYSPELELVWWYGPICRVLAGHFIQSYTGFMWRTKGIGFAIPCDQNGIPDGRLIEITLVEETSPYRIGYNSVAQIHTITGNENWSAILTIDEQENQITCTRNVVQRVKENKQTFPTLYDIPTSTSQLTNDSGFITASQVPTPSYIEDATGNRINADRSVSYIGDGTPCWQMVSKFSTIPKTINLEGTKTDSSFIPTGDLQDGDVKVHLTYTMDEWQIEIETWDAGLQEWGASYFFQDTQSGESATELNFGTPYIGSCVWTTPKVVINDNLVTELSLSSILANLEARIAALENN